MIFTLKPRVLKSQENRPLSSWHHPPRCWLTICSYKTSTFSTFFLFVKTSRFSKGTCNWWQCCSFVRQAKDISILPSKQILSKYFWTSIAIDNLCLTNTLNQFLSSKTTTTDILLCTCRCMYFFLISVDHTIVYFLSLVSIWYKRKRKLSPISLQARFWSIRVVQSRFFCMDVTKKAVKCAH